MLAALGLGGLLALFISLYPGPGITMGILGLIAAGVAALAFFNRRAALYLMPPAIALTPELPLAGVPLRIEDLLMVPLAAGWLAHLCISKERQRTPLDGWLFAYLFIGLFATVWGANIGSVHIGALSKDAAAPFHLLKRLEFLLLFLIVCDTLRSAVDVRRMTYVLMASMIGLSAFAVLQYQSDGNIAVGPADPGHEAGLASMINVALGLSLLPAAKRGVKVLLIAIVVLSLAVLPSTLGRNYIATTTIVMLYIGVFHQRWVLVFFPLGWIAALHLYPPHVVQHVLTLSAVLSPDVTGGHSSGASLLSRAGPPATFGLLGLGHSPILGFGLASRSLGAIDSEYATQLYYTGLAGLAIFLMLGARLFGLTRAALSLAGDALNRGIARGFYLIWVAYAVHSAFSPGISASRVGAIFFLVAGLVIVLHRSLAHPVGEAAGEHGASAVVKSESWAQRLENTDAERSTRWR